METILKKNTSKGIWDAMKRKYEGNTRVKRSTLQGLRRDFETLEMKSGETITVYFSRVMAVANKMRVYGDVMTDVTMVEKILRLDESFKHSVKLGNNTKIEVTGKGVCDNNGKENTDEVGNNGENISEIGSGNRRNESPTNGDNEDSGGSIGKRVGNRPG
ncbi:hypothetical protein JRO89_XS05G0148700 [Xanthoceras sorbifolium]|uniref:Uncharacterized protein n=1 Tax=Xanthoceras sorbifolium TaxID=99658 RepID=A0ABQ8I2G0_9ROSI|nr:hypothetical protein JRO89_XS05G0148700 [Xanthoceras sorbifolium]